MEELRKQLDSLEAKQEKAKGDPRLSPTGREEALQILSKAEKAGNLSTALKAIREARECLKMLAKLEGVLWERKEVEISSNPFAGLTTDELRQLINDNR